MLEKEEKALFHTTVTKVIEELDLPFWSNRKKRNRPRYMSFERSNPNELW